MMNPTTLYSDNIFGRDYDMLPSSGNMGPNIFLSTLLYFEQNIPQLTIVLSELCSFSFPIEGANTKNREMSSLCFLFSKWLKELPKPFFSSDLFNTYKADPCITTAQKVVAALPNNKRPLFLKFLKILRDVTEGGYHPFDFDSFFGMSFFHCQSLSFFSIITKQSSFLSFPFLPFQSFIQNTPIDKDPKFVPLNIHDISTEPSEIRSLYQSITDKVESNPLFVLRNKGEHLRIDQLEELKHFLKHLLKEFENKLSTILKRPLSNNDKSPLEQLYIIHATLRTQCRSNVKVDELKNEKKKVKLQIQRYQSKPKSPKSPSRDSNSTYQLLNEQYQEIKKRIKQLQISQN